MIFKRKKRPASQPNSEAAGLRALIEMGDQRVHDQLADFSKELSYLQREWTTRATKKDLTSLQARVQSMETQRDPKLVARVDKLEREVNSVRDALTLSGKENSALNEAVSDLVGEVDSMKGWVKNPDSNKATRDSLNATHAELLQLRHDHQILKQSYTDALETLNQRDAELDRTKRELEGAVSLLEKARSEVRENPISRWFRQTFG